MDGRYVLVRSTCALALSLALAGSALAQTDEPAMRAVGEVEWAEIIPGVYFAAESGEYMSEAHAKLIKFDPGVETPPHTHSAAYHGIVVSGVVTNPYKGEADPPRMGPGDYWYVPGGVEHVTACVSEEPCLFYTHSDHAWDVEIVEWAD